MLFISMGCSADVDNNINVYHNIETKAPAATGTASGDDNDAPVDENSPEISDDGSDVVPTDEKNNIQETSNMESYLPQNTTSPSGGSSVSGGVTGSPVSTSAPSTDVTVTATAAPTGSPSGQATLKPSASAIPVITPTVPPVITPGPENYFILTIDNGGGGGYVYINQGQDGATNINKGWYDAGDYVSISAVAYEGCTFDGWYVGEDFVSPYADYSFYMPARDYPLTARFVF